MNPKIFKERGWRRLLSFVLALVMVFTLSPIGNITAYAMGITVTVVNSGTNIELDVELSDSVEAVKEKLAEISEISIENQILKFNGEELENNECLAAYSIQKGATLTLESKSSAIQISGSGTAENPYIINNTEELNAAINSNVDTSGKYYKLSDDFDNTTVLTDPLDGKDYVFAGTFDGNGKTVRVNINYESSDAGLFRVNKGQISNINVVGTVSGSMNIGGICGRNIENGQISNCSNSAKVTGTQRVGGICGYNQGSITECSNDGSITADVAYAGGIAGKNGTSVKDAPVEKCTNSGNVTCNSYKDYTGYNDSKMAYSKSDGFYKVIGKIGDTWHQIHSYNDDNRDYTALYTQTNDDKISVSLEPELISGGNVLKFTITIKNTTSDEVNDAKVAVYGDTELSGCDRSINKTNSDKTIMDMSYNGVTFFAFSKDGNFQIVNTSLEELAKNLNTLDIPQVNDPCDSAFLAKWNIDSIAANETITRTFYMGCTEGENLSETELNRIVNSAVHTHDWRYSVNGNKVETYCAAEGCTSGTSESNKLSLTLSAADTVYSNKAYAGANIENGITEITGDAASAIQYVGRDGTDYTESENAPKDAGKYTAKVTIGEVTATANFEIKKADLEPTVSLDNWVYGQKASTPVVEGNKRNGLVTYYYKLKDADDSTYVAINQDLNFSNIHVGNYTLKACIGETTNYNAATAYCDFSVTKNAITVKVSMDGWTYGDTAKTPSVTTDSNPGNGEVTYTYYTNEDCTDTTTSANGAASAGAVPKNAGTYYVKADVLETDNYASGSGKTAFTITKKNITATVSAKNKTYDGTLNADVEAAVSASDLVSGDKLEITGITGTFADKNAGNNKTITVDSSNPKIAGTGADNYNVTIEKPETITASINKRVVELKWNDDPTYNGTDQRLTATVSNAVSGDEFKLTYEGNTQTAVGDNYTAKVTDLGNDNYTLEGAKTSEHKWSINYLNTDSVADITQKPDGSDGWFKHGITVNAPQGYQISEDGVNWTNSLSYNKDGEFTKDYYLKDSQGYITDKKELTFKIDQTAPTGSVKIGENIFDKILNKITFGYFFKDYVDIEITGSDETSDIAKVEYQKVAKDEAFDVNGKWTTGTSIKMTANDKSVIYVRLTDKAGNQSIINTDGIVVYTDATASDSIEYKKFSESDATSSISINGNTVKSIKCGDVTLNKGTDYDIEKNKIVFKNGYLKNLATGDYTFTVSYNPAGETYTDGTSHGVTANDSTISLIVKKASAEAAATKITNADKISKNYDGKQAAQIESSSNSKGTPKVEYKKKGADDKTYSETVPSNAGEYTVRVTYLEDENYAESTAESDFTISRADAVLTVKNAVKHAGKADPEYTYDVTGLIGTDKLDGITFSREEGEQAGTYKITASVNAESDPNYNVKVVDGELTIEDHVKAEIPVEENRIEPTCTKEGSYDEVYYCTVDGCKAELERIHKTIPATGHKWSDWKVTKEATATEEGKKEAVCAVCGHKKYDVIPATGTSEEDPATGTFDKEVQVSQDAPLDEATMTNSKSELLKADNIFDKNEKEQIEKGDANAKVWLEISKTDESKIASEVKAEVEAKAKEITGNDTNKLTYFDADLFKLVSDTDGNIITPKTQISEPGTAINVTFKIPDAIRVTEIGSTARVYKLIRIHTNADGTVLVEAIDGEYNEESGEFSTSSDKFSTYAIVYSDVPVTVSFPKDDEADKPLTSAGEKRKLTAEITPDSAADRTIKWTSSNPKVATVDENGVVTAVADGTATITATVGEDGPSADYIIKVEIKENSSDEKPSESKPSESKPSESKPSESKPSENKPSDSKTDENVSDGNKTDENKTDESKTDNNLTEENKTTAGDTADTNADSKKTTQPAASKAKTAAPKADTANKNDTKKKAKNTGDNNAAWPFVVTMFAGVTLAAFGRKKKENR